MEKVGRLYIQIKKKAAPARWRRVFADEDFKPVNMHIWMPIYNKYIDALEDFEPFDEDDE